MIKGYSLTSENVDVISDVVARYMGKYNMPKKDVIRGRLAVESVLLFWMEQVPDVEISLVLGKRFLRPYIRLQFEGQMINPFAGETDDDFAYYGSIIGNVGLNTGYQYNEGTNYVNIDLPLVNIGNSGKILLAIVLAFITYFGLNCFGSDVAAILSEQFLTPIFNSLINLLSAIAAFMIFFNILYGVISMGNVANLNTAGFKILRLVLGRNSLAIILGMLVCSLAFDVVELRTDFNVYLFKALFNLLVSIVPNNLIQPFIDGDTLRIIFLAVSTGIILLALGRQTKGIVTFVKEWNVFFSTAVNYFCALVPVVVYLALTSVLMKGHLKNIWAVWKILLVVALIGFIYLVADTALAGLRSGIGIRKYVYSMFPMMRVALTTGNAAACGTYFEQACSKIGFVKSFYEYSSVGCQILTSTGTVIVLMTTIMGFQEFCGQSVSLSEFLISGFVYLLIAPSTFAIPGGSISVVALLMSHSFLPDYCLEVYIATNLLFDMLITVVNEVSSVNNLVNSAYVMGMIKRK